MNKEPKNPVNKKLQVSSQEELGNPIPKPIKEDPKSGENRVLT